MFWLTAVLALPALFALAMIQPTHEVIPQSSSKRDAGDESEERETLLELLRDRRMLIFAACVVLFHLSNAAMLNLAAGEVTAGMGETCSS